MIQNVVSKAETIDGVPRVRFDFDNGTVAANAYGDGTGFGAKEGMGAPSDSGSPVFIGGKIAGAHKGPAGNGLDGVPDTRDFGEISSSIRVSSYKDFVQDSLVGQYDLVLNMNNQIWGDDTFADNITARTVGDQFQIYINGTLRYQDNVAWIKSVKIIGSDDSETITDGKIKPGINVRVGGGIGNDTININGVSEGGSLWAQGDDGDDTFNLGFGAEKLASQIINASVQLYGNQGTNTVRILDRNATDTLPDYEINETTFTRPFVDPVIYFAQKVELYTRTAGPTGSKVQVNG